MASFLKSLLIPVLFVLLSANVFAGSRLEVGTKLTYTTNLLSDSREIEDIYLTNNASVNLYPLPFMELNANGLQKAHRDSIRYDNATGGFGMKVVVPTAPESPLDVHSQMLFSGSRYGESLDRFSSNTFSVRAAAGYWIGKRTRVRMGVFHDRNAYISSDEMDRQTYEVYAGANFSVLGSNSLDIEAGFADAKYQYISPEGLEIDDVIDPNLEFVTFTDGHLESFYISPRYSRSIGDRSGISVTFTYKEFPNLEEGVVYSASADNLSPWSDVWQGRSISFAFKTYLIPHMIASAAADYADKSFLKVYDDPEVRHYSEVQGRDDEQVKLNLNIQRPIPGILGFSGEPSLDIEWTNNPSSKRFYDYSGVAVNLGFKLRF